MYIFNQADKLLLQLLGNNKCDNTDARPLKWLIKFYVQDGIVLHNFLTGESVFFEDEADLDMNREYLHSRYFFVPDAFDDKKIVNELRKAIRLINKKDYINSFKILTTTACNAGCAYCYEAGIPAKKMSLETAGAVIKYIKEASKGKGVTLSWFGGEPLMNTYVIDYICMGLRDTGIEYSSVMTSNGYLFDSKLIKRALKSWRLKNIQITLDGTRDNYNRIKAYKKDTEDAYTRVINNIIELTKNKIRVNIRLNMSHDNFEDLLMLAAELDSLLKSKEYVSVYASALFQDTEDGADTKGKALIFEKLRILTDSLYKYGLAKKSSKALKLRAAACMADKDTHRGINPEGKIMKCEHHIFTMLTGDIEGSPEDAEVLSKWKTPLKHKEICESCPAFPICYKLKNCPVSHICSPEEKEQYIESLKQALTEQFKNK